MPKEVQEKGRVDHTYLDTDCRFCRGHNYPPEGMTGQCRCCGGIFCFGHLGPESHDCQYLLRGGKDSADTRK